MLFLPGCDCFHTICNLGLHVVCMWQSEDAAPRFLATGTTSIVVSALQLFGIQQLFAARSKSFFLLFRMRRAIEQILLAYCVVLWDCKCVDVSKCLCSGCV